jgi:predicted DNA-binding transcriptional regulator AlpA
MHVIRLQEVCKLTGLSRTTLWRLERMGQFPERIQLSRNAVGWNADDVHRWLATRPRGLRSRAPHLRRSSLHSAEENLQ